MNGLLELATLRLRMARNSVRMLRTHSLLKLAVVTLFALAFWGGVFLVFLEGFEFLNRSDVAELKPILVDLLFALFFMSLMLMLTFSNGIISFSSLFRSAETEFLFSNPLDQRTIFAYKLYEGLVFSSWAFLFLGAPVIFSYGVSSQVAWHFYPGSVAFVGVFVFVPAGLGAIGTLLIGRYFAHNPRRIFALVAGATLICLTIWGTGLLRDLRFGFVQAQELWVRNILGKVAWCQNPLLPSYWVSRGIMAISRGEMNDVLFYFLLILSNAMFIMLVAQWLAGRWYRSGYYRLRSAARRKKNYRDGIIDRLLWRLLFPLDPSTRLLVIKDIKTFRRDAAQWSQVLIFFGLLTIYLLNMRRLRYHVTMPYWKNLVSFLNLTAVSLTLSTFTSRFIYPLLSLEGRKFWILGLLPVPRHKILMGKFLFAFLGSLVISESLMLLSDVMLKTELQMALLHCFAVLIICAGLAGISVGLGALFPNLREDNPSKIVSGFGGTLNLLLSMVFVFSVIALFAVPCHLYLVRAAITAQMFGRWIVRSTVIALILTGLATLLPLEMGRRVFDRMEV